MRAVLCPVCNGSGEYYKPPGSWSTAPSEVKVCHGCQGKGWVEVHEDYQTISIPSQTITWLPNGDWWDSWAITPDTLVP